MAYFYYNENGELCKVPEGEQQETKQKLFGKVEALENQYNEWSANDQKLTHKTVIYQKVRSLLSEIKERNEAGEDLQELEKRVTKLYKKLK